MSAKLRIVFMGTPDFAVPSLQILIENHYPIIGVITSPDKPSGRGLQMHPSPVKKFALEHGLKVLQPANLKSPDFINELKELNADLNIIVAFRMLPEDVWNMPPMGSLNLHASLLPQYRGAAPLNWAIINGEKETGISTFFLKHKIDTGNLILQEKIAIPEEMTTGELHDIMMEKGANLVLKTLNVIENNKIQPIAQDQLISQNMKIKAAPKILKEQCQIHWNRTTYEVYNLIRGLSPYPSAYTEMTGKENLKVHFKIFKAQPIYGISGQMEPGLIYTDGKNYIHAATSDGLINILELQQAGKKRLDVKEFLKGFRVEPENRFQ